VDCEKDDEAEKSRNEIRNANAFSIGFLQTKDLFSELSEIKISEGFFSTEYCIKRKSKVDWCKCLDLLFSIASSA